MKDYIFEPDGLKAQLVEHCTGIAEVMGWNPVQALILFQALIPHLLKLCIYLR